MCCFSGSVSEVSGTQIFARSSGKAQILVYSMSLLTDTEVAMILPLPVPPRSPEGAVRFINLEAYPQFFKALDSLFPQKLSFSLGAGPVSRGLLAVHDVGEFEASFVPSIADFERLDPRFRLPPSTWRELPQYGDWGFAVFKLKQRRAATPPPKGGGNLLKELFGFGFGTGAAPEVAAPPASEPRHIHPMAFEFPRRDPTQLFFPTVHVHDGQVHASASFDHELYFQSESMPTGMNFPGIDSKEILKKWDSLELYLGRKLETGTVPVEQRMDLQRAAGTLSPSVPLHRLKLEGTLPNQDSILEF